MAPHTTEEMIYDAIKEIKLDIKAMNVMILQLKIEQSQTKMKWGILTGGVSIFISSIIMIIVNILSK